ncbi:mRNA-decapping enzyme 1B [Smittium culicis]|uniref:mRNA-decapping enzyme 1B n=1 Tax=Smittium culicis TaxID=133412 RepID=A0A1R1YAD8_9FUNG|nr:mRNA-decapping enzyme 1B [Smittium culicis]
MDEALKQQVNMNVLKKHDPRISSIVDSTSHVAVYKYDLALQNWVKIGIEGAMFIFKRDFAIGRHNNSRNGLHYPISNNFDYGIVVLNRLSLDNYYDILIPGIDFQIQSGIIMYKRADGEVYGLWVYEKNDIRRICKQLSICSVKSNNNPISIPNSTQTTSDPFIHKNAVANTNNNNDYLLLQQKIKNMILLNKPTDGATTIVDSTQIENSQNKGPNKGKVFSSKAFFETVSSSKKSDRQSASISTYEQQNSVPSRNKHDKPNHGDSHPSQATKHPPNAPNLMQKLGLMGIQVQNIDQNNIISSNTIKPNNQSTSSSEIAPGVGQNKATFSSEPLDLQALKNLIKGNKENTETISSNRTDSHKSNSKHKKENGIKKYGNHQKNGSLAEKVPEPVSTPKSSKSSNPQQINMLPASDRGVNLVEEGNYPGSLSSENINNSSEITPEKIKDSQVAHESAMELISFLNSALQTKPGESGASKAKSNTTSRPLLYPLQPLLYQQGIKRDQFTRGNNYKNPTYPENRSATVAPLKNAIFSNNPGFNNVHYSPQSIYPPF